MQYLFKNIDILVFSISQIEEQLLSERDQSRFVFFFIFYPIVMKFASYM